jgi:hypothetical protein
MIEYSEMTLTEQWIWRMDWCKRQGLSPANSAIWDISGREFENLSANISKQKMKTDEEIAADIRRDLYYGGVDICKERLNDIRDFELKRQMAEVIREYEGDSHNYY